MGRPMENVTFHLLRTHPRWEHLEFFLNDRRAVRQIRPISNFCGNIVFPAGLVPHRTQQLSPPARSWNQAPAPRPPWAGARHPLPRDGQAGR